MNYNWHEIERDGGRYDFPHTEYELVFPYEDGTPCYLRAKATIKRIKKYANYRPAWVIQQGNDPNEMTWQAEVGATNQMAEYLSNGWDSFFRFADDDFDVVYDEVIAYLDDLMASGQVKQEWIDENVW